MPLLVDSFEDAVLDMKHLYTSIMLVPTDENQQYLILLQANDSIAWIIAEVILVDYVIALLYENIIEIVRRSFIQPVFVEEASVVQ
jgi:hypothetical protein